MRHNKGEMRYCEALAVILALANLHYVARHSGIRVDDVDFSVIQSNCLNETSI